MAPSCHWFGPGDVVCTLAEEGQDETEGTFCARDCLGDFTEDLRGRIRELEDGEQAVLGVCEAHGTEIIVAMFDGTPWLSHLVPWSPAA